MKRLYLYAYPRPYLTVYSQFKYQIRPYTSQPLEQEEESDTDQNTLNQPQNFQVNSQYRPLLGNPATGACDDTRYPFPDLLCRLHSFPVSEDGLHKFAIDDENGVILWQYDILGGVIPMNEENALISEQAKMLMYKLHHSNQTRWTYEKLAQEFGIRIQRVMAIIALKEIEAKRAQLLVDMVEKHSEMRIDDFVKQSVKEQEKVQKEKMKAQRLSTKKEADSNVDKQEADSNVDKQEADSNVDEQEADKEASQETKQPYYDQMKKQFQVDFEELDDDKKEVWEQLMMAEAAERLHQVVDKNIWQANRNVGLGERYIYTIPTFPSFEQVDLKDLPKFVENEISRVNRISTAKRNEKALSLFTFNLNYNLGKTGKSLIRGTRYVNPPVSPPVDVTIVFEDTSRTVFTEKVASQPDGTIRHLTDDEKVLYEMRKRRRRKPQD
eukprot:TRINITY_DN109_c0_g1_i2.p1 TRINITY_DN109_c0_g1~~TRINITY_DN109_c0_g1_i2.p1  ORF type:complete len:439 (+),score=57.67 TRINITY_DN109_c0_g1_i2:1179-2495(+)